MPSNHFRLHHAACHDEHGESLRGPGPPVPGARDEQRREHDAERPSEAEQNGSDGVVNMLRPATGISGHQQE
jgi:hypothetical protein